MLGFAEERGLGGEESEVLALVIQAAVPAAHAVAAGHGGGHHCTDSHGEVYKGDFGATAACRQLERCWVASKRSDAQPQSESTRFNLSSTHPEEVSAPPPMPCTELESHLLRSNR